MFATKTLEHDKIVLEQGIEQGIEQGLEETARRMVDKGFSVNDIADITGLDVKVVERLMVGK